MVVRKPALDSGQSILARIRAALPELAPSERRVAEYILEHFADVVHMSVLELSEATASGQSTVIRCCQTLGLSGFQELKIHLARDTQSLATYALDDTGGDDQDNDLHRVLSLSAQAVTDARSSVDIDAFARAVTRLDEADDILILAYGSSRIVAECARDQFASIGLRIEAPALSNMMYLKTHTAAQSTCALIISHSGSTKETITHAEALRKRGVPVIALTSFRRSPLSEVSDIVLAAGSPERPFRFEYLSARLVHLAIINSLYLALAKRNVERARESLDLYYEADSSWRL
jgi:RpiR family transcriptional regulator, carbohydrate utilization regulator